MPVNGRAKGSAFERQVAKLIIETFKDKGITAKDCYRTPLSGGHLYASKESPSDLVLSKRLAKLFPYAIECKFYKSINLEGLFNDPFGEPFGKWWAQVKRAAIDTTDRFAYAPCLVFKQNRGAIYTMIRYTETISTDTKAVRCGMWTRDADGNRTGVLRFEEFLKLCRRRSQ